MNRHPRTSVGDIGVVARDSGPDALLSARAVKRMRLVYDVQCSRCGTISTLEQEKPVSRLAKGSTVVARCARADCGQRLHAREGEAPTPPGAWKEQPPLRSVK